MNLLLISEKLCKSCVRDDKENGISCRPLLADAASPFFLLFFAAIILTHVLTSFSRSRNPPDGTAVMTVIENPVSESAAGDMGQGGTAGSAGTAQPKSAMAMMNEIARFHGIKNVYKQTGESGPLHERIYHVQLFVGEKEVFAGSGHSIRKAQHAAAQAALTGTTFAAPIPKARKNDSSRKNLSTTPTVELNVLAMRRGLTVIYDVVDPQTIFPVTNFNTALLYDYRNNPNQRHHLKKTPYTAVLSVGDQQFRGTGMTPQGARHDAAEKALRVLRKSVAADPPQEVKSPVSTVHEMAAKMGSTVSFGVVSESGPTHMPNFVMRCSVSDMETRGQGNSKKVAKKNAAAEMVLKLSALPLNNTSGPGSKMSAETCDDANQTGDSENVVAVSEEDKHMDDAVAVTESAAAVVTLQPMRELISPSTSISEDDKDHPVHPVNQLSRLVRAHRKEEPGYLLIYERCIDKKRKEFIVECSVRDPGASILTAVGIDPHRKVAKKKAAEAMIQLILTGRSSPEIHLPPKAPHPPILKDSQNKPASSSGVGKGRERKVSFTDKSSSGNKRAIVDKAEVGKLKSKSSRNIAPGVLLLQQGNTSGSGDAHKLNNKNDGVDASYSEVAEKIMAEWEKIPDNSTDQFDKLQSLVERMDHGNVRVHASDFPKTVRSECLTVITLTTEPPIICHASGNDAAQSREGASKQLLSKIQSLASGGKL